MSVDVSKVEPVKEIRRDVILVFPEQPFDKCRDSKLSDGPRVRRVVDTVTRTRNEDFDPDPPDRILKG